MSEIALSIKTQLVNRLLGDIDLLEKDFKTKHAELNAAIDRIQKLSEDEVMAEVITQTDNLRFLAQFASYKTERDLAKQQAAETAAAAQQEATQPIPDETK